MTVTIKGVSPHADFYPMLSDEALAELAEDIKTNGQRDPITVNSAGILLDGRNRLKACQMIGIAPLIEVYEGDDDGAFVRSRNERRHQSVGSRAMSTALSLIEDDLRENGRWKRGSVVNDGSVNSGWGQRLKEAGVVLDYAADLADDVVSGKIALDAAYREAKAEKERCERERREREEFEANQAKNEAEAERFFQTKTKAMEWYGAQPEGKYQTWLEAKTGYLAYDKEQAWEEEKARREEERREQTRRESHKRDADRIRAFLGGYDVTYSIVEGTHHDTAEVLDLLAPHDRKRFNKILEETTWPDHRP